MDLLLENGDIVSIRYNEHITKVATVREVNEDSIEFFDIDTNFELTKKFINRSGIIITVLETD
jgi:hypothetical protein